MVPLKYSTSKDGPTRALFTDQIDVHFWDWKWLISVEMNQKKFKSIPNESPFKWSWVQNSPSFQTTHPATSPGFFQHFLDRSLVKLPSISTSLSDQKNRRRWFFWKPGVKLNAGERWPERWYSYVICNEKHPPPNSNSMEETLIQLVNFFALQTN